MKKLIFLILIFSSILSFGQTPPSIDATSNNNGATSSANSLTGVTAGNLLALVIVDGDDNTVAEGSVSSSPSLTWTKRVHQYTAGSGTVVIYTAVFTAGGSITVTTSWPGGNHLMTSLYSISNYNSTLNTSGVTASGQSSPSISLTTSAINSLIIGGTSDWNAVNGSSRTYTGTPTEQYYQFTSGIYTGYSYYKATTSATTYTIGISSPTGMAAGSALYEIKGAGGNIAPTANAGSNQSLSGGTTSTTLNGTASSDPDGTISSYAWTLVSGPNTPTIVSPSAATTSVTGMTYGTYIFQLVVTDNLGATGSAQVQVYIPFSAPAGADTIAERIWPFDSTDLITPDRGAEHWMSSDADFDGINAVKLPAATDVRAPNYYKRINWAQIETAGSGTTPGSPRWDWTVFDQEIHYAIDHGQKFSFGILTIAPAYDPYGAAGAANLSYPTWLHNKMQTETPTDFQLGNDWIPNWNSPSFLAALDSLNNAVAYHLAHTYYTPSTGPKAGTSVLLSDAVFCVDIRGYGQSGEWNMAGFTGGIDAQVTAGYMPTGPTYKHMIQSHIDAFPNYRLQLMMNTFDNTTTNSSYIPDSIVCWALQQSNSKGLFGWRRDNWGVNLYATVLESNSAVYNGFHADTAIMNRWKYGPITGEPYNGSLANINSVPYGDLPAEVQQYHANSFGNNNYYLDMSTTLAGSDSVRLASKYAGYRISIISGSVDTVASINDSIRVILNFQNSGITPPYSNWDAVIELTNSSDAVLKSWTLSWTPTMMQPGTQYVNQRLSLSSVTAQTGCKIKLVIKDHSGYSSPMVLANTAPTKNTDGSYTLMTGIDLTNSSNTINSKKTYVGKVLIIK